MSALLPPVDALEPDDADLAVGRALVDGFRDAARGTPTVADLEAPRPTTGVRAGLSAIAVFGTLSEAAAGRAMTAVFAAGLAARAQARAGAAAAPPDAAHIGLRVPFSLVTPPGGHGVIVEGAMMLELASIAADDAAVTAGPAVTLELAVADTDAWLLGGPGTTPVGGALALELRRLSARVRVGLHGGASDAAVFLEEGSALGADWVRLVVRSPAAASGQLELEPLLPEAAAALSAVVTNLGAAIPASPAGALVALLKASGVSQDDGALRARRAGAPAARPRRPGPGGAGRAGRPRRAARRAARPAPGALRHRRSRPRAARPADRRRRPRRAHGRLHRRGRRRRADLARGRSVRCHRPPARSRPGSAIRRTIRLRCRCSRARCARSCCARARRPCPLWPALDVDGLAGGRGRGDPGGGAAAPARRPAQHRQPGRARRWTTWPSALGMLRAPDDRGSGRSSRRCSCSSDPAGWLRQAGVLSTVGGGPLDAGQGHRPARGGQAVRRAWPGRHAASGRSPTACSSPSPPRGAGPTVVARRSTPRHGWPGWPGTTGRRGHHRRADHAGLRRAEAVGRGVRRRARRADRARPRRSTAGLRTCWSTAAGCGCSCGPSIGARHRALPAPGRASARCSRPG